MHVYMLAPRYSTLRRTLRYFAQTAGKCSQKPWPVQSLTWPIY